MPWVRRRRYRKERSFATRNVSDALIKDFVQRLLEDEKVNSPYIPDVIERYVYEPALGKVMNTLKNVLQTVSIRIMDHEIVLTLRPVE
jgi:hypothetical protein